MSSKENLISLLTDYLSHRSEILFAYLFGSAVDSESYNDIDVGIYVSDLPRVGNIFEYALAMSMDLERLLGKRADVIVMNNAHDRIVFHVSKGKLLVDRDDDLRADVLSGLWKRYWDYGYMRDKYLLDVAENVGTS